MNPKHRCLVAVITLCTAPFLSNAEVDDADWYIQVLKGDTDSDILSRQAAMEMLAQIKDARAVAPLVAALKDNDFRMRMAAAEALGGIKDAQAVEPLLAALKDNDLRVRVAVAKALDQIPDERAAEAFARSEWAIAMATARAQLATGDEATLKRDPPLLRQAAAKVLGQTKDAQPIEALAAALRDSDVGVRLVAAEALGQTRDVRAVRPLVEALKQNSIGTRTLFDRWRERRKLTEALATIGGPAVEPLVAALKDRDSHLRQVAAEALGRIGDRRAVEPLMVALKDSDSPNVRTMAVWALGQIRDPRAMESVLVALRGDDQFLSQAAARALGQTKDAQVVEPLAAALKDRAAIVRMAAVRALEQIGGEQAIAALAAAMPDWDVRRTIGKALVRRGWRPQTEREKIYLWICSEQRDELTQAWEQTRRILLEDMLSSEQNRIESAVFAFISLGREEIIPELANILDKHGNKPMAETYLNSGHAVLGTAAHAWAKQHGYNIATGSGESRATWGKWR